MVDWQLYRSPVLPNPKWKESALYGGYEWVSMTDEFWVNRRWEPDFTIFQRVQEGSLPCRGACIQPFLSMLKDAGFFLNQVNLKDGELALCAKYDDYLRVNPVTQNLKAFWCLKQWTTLIVYGWNSAIQDFVKQYHGEFDKILGTSDMPIVEGRGFIELSSLRSAHLQQKVIVAEELIAAKEYIVNWTHVIVM